MIGDTIAALASPPGPARRGIVRVSGPEARRVLEQVFRPEDGGSFPPAARALATGTFDDGRGEQPALCLWMPAPRSYTCEDVFELHLPGAAPLLEAALARLLALGLRAAAAGEFTRRAFENGRLDLTRAEGVLALVEAANEDERRAATGLLSGGLATRVEGLREALEELAALCEASLDFDEADTGHVPKAELASLLAAARERLERARAFEVERQAPSTLPRLLLVGAPNAGKSTLFNALTSGRALVSERAGTTRDVLTGLWSRPRPLLLVDTPGLDPRAEGLERAAQELARRELDRAALVLWVVDAAAPHLPDPEAWAAASSAGPPVLLWNQIDRSPGLGRAAPFARRLPGAPRGIFALSARTGAGLEALGAGLERLLEPAGGGPAGPSEEGGEGGVTALGRELFQRHREALRGAEAALAEALRGLEAGDPLDQVAQELRGATAALDAITGHTRPDDLLDRVFARFCIGK